MRGVYVYGITARAIRSPGRGIYGRPLRVIRIGPLRVVVEDAGRPPRPTVAKLTKQSRVIAALVESGADILPARFGTYAPEPELRRLVSARREELVGALRRIAGRVQMTVRLKLPASRAPRTSGGNTGTAHLRLQAQRAQQHAAHPLVQAIQRGAQAHARQTRLESREGSPTLVTLHHLVARGRVGAYERAVLEAADRAGAEATVSGPWAPFAFAELR